MVRFKFQAMKLEKVLRQALTNEHLDECEVVQGQPGQQVFWLIEELIHFNGFDTFLDLLQHGQEILWKKDDMFPFVLFYTLAPFLAIKQFASGLWHGSHTHLKSIM